MGQLLYIMEVEAGNLGNERDPGREQSEVQHGFKENV